MELPSHNLWFQVAETCVLGTAMRSIQAPFCSLQYSPKDVLAMIAPSFSRQRGESALSNASTNRKKMAPQPVPLELTRSQSNCHLTTSGKSVLLCKKRGGPATVEEELSKNSHAFGCSEPSPPNRGQWFLPR